MTFDFLKRSQREQELEEELQSHLRLAAQDGLERGQTQADASAAARREMGNVALIKEVTRDMWGWTMLERFLQDVRFGFRVLRKNPGATLVAILTLALGISASTAIFSVVYGILLRPLPYQKPQQIVQVWEVTATSRQAAFTDPNFDDVRAQSHSLQAVAQFNSSIASILSGSESTRANVADVSKDFIPVLGIHPIRGREFVVEEQHVGAAPAALVSYSFWQQHLNGAEDLASIKLVVGNKATSVIGVFPPGFSFPAGTDLWMARETDPWLPSRNAHNWSVIGRLREGVSVSQAQNEIGGIGRRLKQQYGQEIDMQDAAVVPLKEALTGSVRPAMLILLGAVGVLLLVACANVMNLLLAQAFARESELAVRTALGASRGRLVRQFLAEALLLSLCGGSLGVLAAYFGVGALIRMAPAGMPRVSDVGVNLPVLFFALGLSVAVAAVLGVITALRASSANLHANLAEGSRGQSNARRGQRLGRMIIAGQLAMTMLLLVGAGLEGRSLLRVLSVDPGFRTDQVVTLTLDLAPGPGLARVQRVAFLNSLFDRLRALPGVTETGGTNVLPLGNDYFPDGAFVELNPAQLSPRTKELIELTAHTPIRKLDPQTLQEITDFMNNLFHDKAHGGYADHAVASEGYFRTLGIPLLRGRLFEAGDTEDKPHVAVISESLARSKWPGQDALGHTIEFGNMDGDLRLLTIVGVVGDVRQKNLESEPRPTVYVNYRQRPMYNSDFTVVIRTAADPAATLAAARKIVKELDPTLPPKTDTLTGVLAASLLTRRFNLILVGIFAASALVLAMVGIYGVMAYSVARRSREIGVRIALGATGGNVLRLVLRQALLTALAGVAAGMVGSLLLTRLVRSLLFEISPTDPLTFTGVALVSLAVAALAAYAPARRAASIDPLEALRSE
jgi:ABC-type antimicrobial peptide transport system permease subunit